MISTRSAIVVITFGLLLQGCLADETKEGMICKTPDGNRCSLEGKLNEEPFNWEMDYAWSYEDRGIRLGAFIAPPEQGPYRGTLSITPAIEEVVLEQPFVLDNYQRLDAMDIRGDHSFINEGADDFLVGVYRLEDGDTSNIILFTHYEEIPGERFQAVVEGELVTTHHVEDRYRLDDEEASESTAPNVIVRRLPDTVAIRQASFRTILRDFEDYEYWARKEGGPRHWSDRPVP